MAVSQPFNPSTNPTETVRIMLGPTVVELKATLCHDGSPALDIHLQQHHNPTPAAPPPTSTVLYVDEPRATRKLPPPSSQGNAVRAPGTNAEEEWVKEMRGWLMVLASLFASMAYQAGLNPPGGFWQDTTTSPTTSKALARTSPASPIDSVLLHDSAAGANGTQHQAGRPILYDTSQLRFNVFFWLNSIAFTYSMSVVIVLLLSENLFYSKHGLRSLRALLVINSLVVTAAFATGCGRNDVQTTIPVLFMIGALVTSGINVWNPWATESNTKSTAKPAAGQ